MMKSDDREIDLHGKFMNSESVEKAPEGFTEKVMSAVRVESQHVLRKEARVYGKIVPAAVITVMLILIIISLFTGADDNTAAASEISKFFQHILPQIKSPALPGINIPGIAIYISLGIFVLWIFDLLLGRVFYRRH